MTISDTRREQPGEEINVAWPDVIRFIRQLSHDLRNHLNAVELQSAFIAELATDPELKEEVARLRKMVSDCGSALQKLSSRLNPPAANIVSYSATDFVEDLQAKVQTDFPNQASSLQWTIQVEDGNMDIDPVLLREALLDVVKNAFEHLAQGASLHFIAKTEGDTLVIALHEPKPKFDQPTDQWGRQPLRYATRGHYGLGLNRARTIIEAHGGTLRARYDSEESKLITSIDLPLSSSSHG
jgi:K+-sensing histidine kinase KdpD